MTDNKVEKKIRHFFIEDMVKDTVKNASNTDELDLDSLDQTELRVFLDEDFGIKFSELPDIDPFTTIQEIVDFIHKYSRVETA
ncbi:acyl carrier protein [Pseudomonas syringae]|uniref:acyl carrier protein n=1 Tax=Pseudomonas syringae TaxID=317 RepID=UPI000E32AD5B|nr:acyl carrier protein [Pseudomonas syringae]